MHNHSKYLTIITIMFCSTLFTSMSNAAPNLYTYHLTQSTADINVWTTPPSHRVFKDDVVPSESGDQINVAAAKNEFEPFVLVVKASSEQDITVHFTDFGNNITGEIYQIKYVHISQTTDNLGRTGDYPDPLWPVENHSTIHLSANENIAFWFSLYVPKTTASGNYSSTVTIGNISIPAVLHVFNFAIPDELHVKSQMNVSFQAFLEQYSVSDGYWTYVDKIKQFFIDHRLTPKSALWPGGLTGKGGASFIDYNCDTGELSDPHGIWGFEIPANTYLNGNHFNNGQGFPSFMAMTFQNNDASADQRPSTFCNIPRTSSDWYDSNQTESDYNRKWFSYISDTQKYLKENNYLDKAYYYFANEPQDQDDYDAVAWYSQELKRAAPELKLMLSEEPKPEIFDHPQYSDAKIDIWLPVLNQYNPEISHDRAKNHNEDTWIYFLHGTRPPYFNPITLDHPGIESKLTGWFLWKYRIRGIAYYSLNNWSKNPWTDPMTDNHNGDLFMLYPPSESNEPIAYGSNNHRLLPSIRFELMRDSLEDYEYLLMLNQGKQPLVDQQNEADTQADKMISGLTSYTRNDQFMYQLRWYIGMKIGNEINEIPDISPPNIHPRTIGAPGNYYINFQNPDAEPLDNPLIIDQKEYMKIGWHLYDETAGYGWHGEMKHVMYQYLSNGLDERQKSILYDDWGRQKTFEFDLPNGRYMVTVSVGWQDRTYSHNKIDIEGISFIDDEASQPYIIRSQEINITDNKLTMEMGIHDNYTMLNYLDIEAVIEEEQLVTPLVIKETLGIARTNEMICNGVPLDRNDQVTDISNLCIENDQGEKIPACFEVLSRWAGGKNDTSCNIQWLLVNFPASINANATRMYYLKKGAPKIADTAISMVEDDQRFYINTGKADFVIQKARLSLFDSISVDGASLFSSDDQPGSSSQIHGQDLAHATPPKEVVIERRNDHYLVIKLSGDYDNQYVGTTSAKPLSYKIRYEFFAGSSTAIIYHKFYWAGSNGGYYNGDPITIDRVSLNLPVMNQYLSTDVYADASTFFKGALSGDQTASVHQKLRTVFENPHVAEVIHGQQITTVPLATQAMLINHAQDTDIAVSIDHMQYFEPQSIETQADGKITVNVLAENQFFADYQGTWARIGISALPPGTTYETALKENYAPLNNRLFAFPPNSYCVKSGVFLETPYIPDQTSPSELNDYYEALKKVTQTTRTFLKQEKFQGLMTWGGLVRYASLNGYSETGSGTGWDKVYSGGALTDYHGAWKNVVYQFIMEGNPCHLYDLSFMGARRMLHTQIFQPDDPDNPSSSYMGWAPTGYAEYRADFNSSHSYFDNLMNYYYMTGDMEVIDILKLAGQEKKKLYTREAGQDWQYKELNDQNSGGSEWVGYVDRVGMQMASIFHFLGHSFDPSYLDDFKHMFNHAFSQSLALLKDDHGQEYTFLSNEKNIESGFTTSQHWMVSLYFMHQLYLLYDEWGDLTPGSDNISISRVFKGLANTYMTFVSKDDYRQFCFGQSGCSRDADGTWSGSWNNRDRVYFSGNRIGGMITNIEDIDGNSDACLWSTGKAPIITQILRAGKMNNDNDLVSFGRDGITYMADIIHSVGDNHPWSKETSMYFIRLHHAMAYLSEEDKTDFVATVQNDCTGQARCYASLNDWEHDFGGIDFKTCPQGDLVCLKQNAILEIKGSWPEPDTHRLIIDGWTTSADHRIEIRATGESHHSGVWDSNAYRLEITATGDYQAPIYIQDDYVIIDGLQLSINPDGFQSTRGITSNTITSDLNLIQVSNCIIKSTGTGGNTQGISSFDPDANYHIWNNIIYDFSSYGIKASTKFYVYHNTIYNCNQGINSGGAVIKNNAVFQSTSGYDYANNFNEQSTHNASSDHTANNNSFHLSNGVIELRAEDQFIDVEQRDFRLKPTSMLKDAGIDLLIDTYLPISKDIKGSERNTWDIGAHAYTFNTLPGDVHLDHRLDLKDVILMLRKLAEGDSFHNNSL